tara:strand:+ start:19 stop:210 length:192 start_codon:yes stop_codon:yes gene_type:complete
VGVGVLGYQLRLTLMVNLELAPVSHPPTASQRNVGIQDRLLVLVMVHGLMGVVTRVLVGVLDG